MLTDLGGISHENFYPLSRKMIFLSFLWIFMGIQNISSSVLSVGNGGLKRINDYFGFEVKKYDHYLTIRVPESATLFRKFNQKIETLRMNFLSLNWEDDGSIQEFAKFIKDDKDLHCQSVRRYIIYHTFASFFQYARLKIKLKAEAELKRQSGQLDVKQPDDGIPWRKRGYVAIELLEIVDRIIPEAFELDPRFRDENDRFNDMMYSFVASAWDLDFAPIVYALEKLNFSAGTSLIPSQKLIKYRKSNAFYKVVHYYNLKCYDNDVLFNEILVIPQCVEKNNYIQGLLKLSFLSDSQAQKIMAGQ